MRTVLESWSDVFPQSLDDVSSPGLVQELQAGSCLIHFRINHNQDLLLSGKPEVAVGKVGGTRVCGRNRAKLPIG